MPKHNAFVFVYDVLYLSYAHFKFFRKRLKTDAINKPPFQDRAVSLCFIAAVLIIDVFIYHSGNMGRSVITHTDKNTPGCPGVYSLISFELSRAHRLRNSGTCGILTCRQSYGFVSSELRSVAPFMISPSFPI